MFYNVVALKNFALSTVKHLCWSRFLRTPILKLESCNFFKKETPAQVFRTNFAKILWGITFCRIPVFHKCSIKKISADYKLYQSQKDPGTSVYL